MSFIRAKEIPPGSGNWYDYEVETIHRGKKVIQKHIRYIGKSGTRAIAVGGGHSTNADSRSDVGLFDTPRPVKQAQPKIACKFCQSQNTRKYGLYKGVQNYFCNDCHTKFTNKNEP